MTKALPPSDVAAMLAEAEAAEKNPRPLMAQKPPQLPAALEPQLSAEEMLDECAAEPPTDIGNGRRLLIRHGGRILHVARVGWHGFDGRHWKEDEDGSVVRPLAQETAEFIDDEARLVCATEEENAVIEAGREARKKKQTMGRPLKTWDAEQMATWLELDDQVEAADEVKKIVNGRKSARHSFAKSSAGTSKLNNMLTEAAPHVAKMVGDMNCDLHAVNLSTGTLRFVLVEDEESAPDDPRHVWQVRLDPHNPADFISKLAPVAFDLNAKAESFEKFLAEVQPDADIRSFLQRFAGYCLTGLTIEQCLVFFYGAGRNGKSTFVDLLCDILGNYAVTLSIDSFAGDSKRGGNEATPDLARLPGARLVAASEPEMGVKLKDALIKTLTGGEKIPVRRLHQDFIEVVPQFKIVLSGNHKPRIDDNSDGIWRRVNLVPWEIQIPKEQVDRALPRRLRQEQAGVFAWMVRGALDYLNFGLRVPEKVRMATEEYREDSDPIGAFIRAACDVSGQESDVSTPDALFIGYTNWASREGQAEFKKVTLLRRFPDYARKSWAGLDDKMRQFWKSKSGNTVYKGIRVKDEWLRNADGSLPPPHPGSADQRYSDLPEGF